MKRIEISDRAARFLEARNHSLDDTWATVLDGLIAEFESMTARSGAAPLPRAGASAPLLGSDLHNHISDLPDVTHSKIKSAKIQGEPVDSADWTIVLTKAIEAAMGASVPSLKAKLPANIVEGKPPDKKGYYFVQPAGLSFQKLRADSALQNLRVLAEEFSVAVDITVHWPNSPDPFRQNQIERITLPWTFPEPHPSD